MKRAFYAIVLTILLGLTAAAVTYTYDAAGHLIKIDYGNGSVITYVYDSAGNLITRSVSTTLTAQTITFGALSNQPYGTAPFTVSATASSGLTVSFVSTTTTVCTVSGSTVTLVAVGTCTIQATQAGNATYAAAAPVNQSFQVTQTAQTITFGALSNQPYGTAPFTVSATASSGLTVSFASTTTAICTVSGSTVTLVAVGTCTIQATQAGNADYAAAAPVNQSFQVTQPAQATLTPTTLSFGNQAINEQSSPKTATLKNGLAVPLTISSITVSGVNAADFVSGGTCPLGPSTLAAGKNCSITLTFKPSNLGSETATLTVSDSALTSPQTAALTGTGVAPVTLSASTLNLGTVAVGNTSAAKTVTLTNHENITLDFSSTLASAGFAVASNTCGGSIAAGATCTVGVTFSPTATGAATGTLTFTDSAANSPQALSLTGTGSAPVTLSPGSLNLGAVAVGNTSAAKTVTLTNHENITLNFSSILASSGFAVASDTCGASIAAGATCTVGVTFSPIATGAATGILTFTDAAANSPQALNLTGTGSTPVTLSPGSLNLGTVAVGNTSAAKTVTLTNHENITLNFSSILASSGFAVASDTCGASIAAGATCTVSVTFSPTATGAATGTLTFTDSAANSPQAVSLTGAGSAPVTLSPGTLNLGTVAVGNAGAAKTVTLTNHENIALNFSSILASAGFAVASNTCGASIATGATCTVGVTFSPTATGAATGTLTFTDSAANSPQAVSLTGTGK